MLNACLKNIMLDHCYQEERNAIQKLRYEFIDICCENIPLKFTDEIKRKNYLTKLQSYQILIVFLKSTKRM